MKKILNHILLVPFLLYGTMFSQTQQLFFDSLNEHEIHSPFSTLQQNQSVPIDSIVVIENKYKKKYSYGYDSTGNISSFFKEQSSKGERKKASRYLLSYNVEGKETLGVFQRWSENDSIWKNSLQVSKNYNSFGKKTTEILKHWSRTKGWRNYSKVTYSYDSLKGNLEYKLKEFWWDSSWVFNEFSSKKTYKYDENNNIVEEFYQTWNKVDSIFEPSVKNIYTYNGDKLNILLTQKFNEDDNWVNYSRSTYTYNYVGDRITDIREVWSENKWVGTSGRTFYPYYDLAKNMISDTVVTTYRNGNAYFYVPNAVNYYVLQAHDAPLILEQTNLFYGRKINIYYHNTSDVPNEGVLVDKYTLLQNYPNPFNPTTTISYSLHKGGLVQLRVFDILGRKVASLVNKEQPSGNYQVDFNASELSSGLYFYKINVGSFTETKKMILIK